jgi:uncharacterized protein YehS (DUF1456 family)
MTNNDILRRLRYIFDLDDSQMIAIFGLAKLEVKRGHLVAWLKREEDPAFQECNDRMLATFLNGLITEKRGKREGPQPKPEIKLSNNATLMKLKIALNLQADDILAILDLAGFQISAHELSSFFRRPGHKNFRDCKDQVLRKFLMGLQLQLRPHSEETPEPVTEPATEAVTEAGAKKPFKWPQRR